MKIFNWKKRD